MLYYFLRVTVLVTLVEPSTSCTCSTSGRITILIYCNSFFLILLTYNKSFVIIGAIKLLCLMGRLLESIYQFATKLASVPFGIICKAYFLCYLAQSTFDIVIGTIGLYTAILFYANYIVAYSSRCSIAILLAKLFATPQAKRSY